MTQNIFDKQYELLISTPMTEEESLDRLRKIENRICLTLNCETPGKHLAHLVCARHWNLMKTYGIDATVYEMVRIVQNYSCAICGVHESEAPRKRLFIDHCHETGNARGLLCHRCNTGIGMMRDSQSVVARAADYLAGV